MNLNPATVLDPVFHFLDGIITEWGVYLLLALVWQSVLVLAWVFSGGLRRKFSSQPHVSAGIGIIIQPHKPPPTPAIIIHKYDPSDDGTDLKNKIGVTGERRRGSSEPTARRAAGHNCVMDSPVLMPVAPALPTSGRCASAGGFMKCPTRDIQACAESQYKHKRRPRSDCFAAIKSTEIEAP